MLRDMDCCASIPWKKSDKEKAISPPNSQSMLRRARGRAMGLNIYNVRAKRR